MTNDRGGPTGPRQQAEPMGRSTNAGASTVRVTVVYALPDCAWQKELTVPAHTDVATVLKLSGFAEAFPAYPLNAPTVGIFGRRCQLDETVSEADRIEIYRPLDFDPMESRRRRAAHRKTAAAAKSAFRPRRVREGNNQ